MTLHDGLTISTGNLTISTGNLICNNNLNVANEITGLTITGTNMSANNLTVNNNFNCNNLNFNNPSVNLTMRIGTNATVFNNDIIIGTNFTTTYLNGIVVFNGGTFNMSTYINQLLF
jgi:hypothetical protein